MMLGIVLHAAALYVTTAPPGLPLVADRNSSVAMDVLIAFIHSFRMPTFFVLAGFFAALLVDKRGIWGTYRNRAARILAPFLAGMVTVLPLSLILFVDFAIAVLYGVHSIVPAREDLERLERDMNAAGAPQGIFLAHLWFLYYLLYFYLLVPACRWLGSRIKTLPRPGWLYVPLSLWTAATLWPFPGGQVFGEFLFLKPYVPGLVYYGSFFVFGYLLHFHSEGFLQLLAAQIPRHLVLALALFPAALLASHAQWSGSGSQAIAVLANGLCTWSLIFLFIGCAMRFFDRASRLSLYASQSAYWVFLVHLPLACLFAWWLVPHDLPALIKFSIVVLLTTVVCFVTYHYWVERTWISVFLNGRRFGTSPPSGNPP